MATLVLSTVGTVLGGPLGGAIGALVGQSFDEQILGPASRGPRLGDLSVQTSSYGTQVPRIYGSMRVAGSVIWATDLVESSQTTGAKGQPDVTYSYSVSFAVALSSRPVKSIKRIWADGKLLRGEEGDFKVSTIFRFYDGSEDQQIDPLIASIEGIANTPAHRGLALTVFENLELADFGNRIPFLTFEIEADEMPPSIGAVLGDCSNDAIACDDDMELRGYAAYGSSIRAAVEPIVSIFDIELFEDGNQLRSPPAGPPLTIVSDEVGNSADNQPAPRLEREQAPIGDLPETLRLSYYDPERDYQTGEARAAAGGQIGREIREEIPGVLSATDAKALAQQTLARRWITRDKLTLRLPPRRMAIEPGTQISLPLSPALWVVEKSIADSFVTIVELHPSWKPIAMLAADSGRVVSEPDIVEDAVTVALLEAPALPGGGTDSPRVLLAASSASPGWKRRPIAVEFGNTVTSVQSAVRKSLLGRTLTGLAEAEPYLIDRVNSVDIELVDATQWLTSCDDEALAGGTNLALVGGELLQFGAVTSLGGGKFRLSRLLRARAGTEWAIESHAPGEVFCLVDEQSLVPIDAPPWSIGGQMSATDRGGASTSITVSGESLRPLSVANLSPRPNSDGTISVTWTRRSRRGWVWIDEVDAPLAEASERYRVNISGTEGVVEIETASPALIISAAELALAGSGPAAIDVRQIGNWAASHPARVSITIP